MGANPSEFMPEPNREKGYLCPDCDETYDSLTDAAECCNAIQHVDHWRCGECGFVHGSKQEAVECCAGWECEKCGEWYDIHSKEDAVACCADEDDNATVTIAVKREEIDRVNELLKSVGLEAI